MIVEKVSHPLEYQLHDEMLCLVVDVLDANPEAVMAMYHVS